LLRFSVIYHYRPTRWDEWISCSSPRLAPFRSRTADTGNSALACPTPVTEVSNAPSTGQDDLRMLVPELSSILRMILPVADKASNDCRLVRAIPVHIATKTFKL
jgi:hypothetical protein